MIKSTSFARAVIFALSPPMTRVIVAVSAVCCLEGVVRWRNVIVCLFRGSRPVCQPREFGKGPPVAKIANVTGSSFVFCPRGQAKAPAREDARPIKIASLHRVVREQPGEVFV